MDAINLILTLIFAIIALIVVTFVIIRAIGNNKKWKEIEPQLIKDIEIFVGQKILWKTMQNASHSMEFGKGKGFWLWMAFSADYAAFVLRDEVAENGGEGHIFIARRKDTSIMRLDKHYAELAFKNRDTPEVFKFIILVVESQYEPLTRFIPVKHGDRGR